MGIYLSLIICLVTRSRMVYLFGQIFTITSWFFVLNPGHAEGSLNVISVFVKSSLMAALSTHIMLTYLLMFDFQYVNMLRC